MKDLKSRLEELANEGRPRGAAEVMRRAAYRSATPHGAWKRGGWHRYLLAAAVAVPVLAVAIGAGLLLVRDTDGGDRRVATPPRATPDSSSNNGFEILGPGPLSTRADVAIVWTGREVVAWGGALEAISLGLPGPNQVLADGASYDPSSRRWRMMSESPLPATSDTPVGVWVEGEVVFFRGLEAAAWDPERNAWRSLPDVPGQPVTAAVWTGEEIVTLPDYAALDPASGSWRRLPDPPVRFVESAVATWTGDELLVVGRIEPFGDGTGDAQGISYNPATERWRQLPPSGVNAQAIDAAWSGHELIVVNYDMSAAAYDPAADRWRPLPSVPARFYEWYPRVVSVGDHIAVFMAEAVAILGPNDHWTPLPYDPLPANSAAYSALGAGDLIYLFGFSFEAKENRFAALDAAAALESVGTIQVGAVSLALPPNFRFESAAFERGDTNQPVPPPETVTAEVANGTGTCLISSTYVGVFGQSALDVVTGGRSQPVTIDPVGGSPPWEGRSGADPERTIVRLDGSDLIEVTCTASGTAHDLARHLSPPPAPPPRTGTHNTATNIGQAHRGFETERHVGVQSDGDRARPSRS